MLDGILGRGFTSKCKSLIKTTKSRIDVLRRKRNATLKFLKKDIADLLANGLDINAYGRADGLLAELTLSSCYEFVEKSGDFVLKHLSVMQKMRHCPEDCREAVSSLMFAAARFSDLPELRDLRDVFYERYGSSVELFANQEFVENLSSKPSTTEKKVKLMRDIASEFGIAWDSRAFEQRTSKDTKTPASAQNHPQVHGSPHAHHDKYKIINGNGNGNIPKVTNGVLPKERPEHANNGYRLLNEKESNVSRRDGFDSKYRYEVPGNGYKPVNIKGEPILNKDTHDSLHKGRHEVAIEKHEPWKEDTPLETLRNGLNFQSGYGVPINKYKSSGVREESIPKRDTNNSLFEGRQEIAVDKNAPWKEDTSLKTVRLGSSSQRHRIESVDRGSHLRDGRGNTVPKTDDLESSSHGKVEIASSFAGLSSKGDGRDSAVGNHYDDQYNATNSAREVQEEAHKLNSYYNNVIPPPYTKPNSRLKDPLRDNRADAGIKSEKIIQEVYHLDHERHNTVGSMRANCHEHENDFKHKDDGINTVIPKPRSSRRRHAKSHSSRNDVGNLEDLGGTVKRRSRSKRRDDSRRGLQVLLDDDHHRNDEEERMIDNLLMHYSSKPTSFEPENLRRKPRSRHVQHEGIEHKSSRNISQDKHEEVSEMLPPPRSISLPREQTTQSEATKVFARAASFQPERSTPAKHVHPKLPDYDDLAARFAAFKGR
ncbi:uncharacterized protein LOC126667947 isoform X1 [Mercurialis annua]|uniref:uncharacterized protein LOC126667947 isoform X1 n=1 Tax=Mercurialis annua TaxID=3986 RepID=UPI00215EDD3A|nr:uncharacterized protein LOC126667947 isoform X1 [Mercurialis annua]